MSETYKADLNHEGLFYTNGPGFGYYGNTSNPQLSLHTQEEADRAVRIANIAYKAGYEQAQRDIRKTLGIN